MVELNNATTGTFSLAGDRQFAMADENGRFVNGKRTGEVYMLQTTYDPELTSVTFASEDQSETFDLRQGNPQLDDFISDFFGLKLRLIENKEGQLQDDPVISSISVIGQSSLQTIMDDLQLPSLEDTRLRFRSNIELSGVEAFWEDQLYDQRDVGVRFRIGDVELVGVSPRARCSVPPKDPTSGQLDKTFMKAMMESRAKHLPENSTLDQFGGNLYYLAVDSYLSPAEIGKTIRLQDEVEILGKTKLDQRTFG